MLGEDGAPAGSLLEHVQSHPESLGSGATAAGDIPFLLKVLSVNIALSIQAHPDLALAGELHAARPDLYKDANHKPEMAVALGTFEALCGFRPVSELRAHAAGVPELAAVLGDAAVNGLCSADAGVAATKAAFGALMTADDALVKAQLDRLVARLSAGPDAFNVLSEPLRALLLRLAEQYPGDAGIFCALVLNYLVLADGEAIFLPANTPHAYLAGDCVECMASSDNVVRAGLTPKYRDIGTLLRMLDYASSPPDQLVLRGSKDAGSADGVVARTFKPPVNEFLLQVVSVAPGVADVAAEAVTGPSILIFTAGAADIKGALMRCRLFLLTVWRRCWKGRRGARGVFAGADRDVDHGIGSGRHVPPRILRQLPLGTISSIYRYIILCHCINMVIHTSACIHAPFHYNIISIHCILTCIEATISKRLSFPAKN